MGDAEINMKYMWIIVKRSNKYVIEFSGGVRKYNQSLLNIDAIFLYHTIASQVQLCIKIIIDYN